MMLSAKINNWKDCAYIEKKIDNIKDHHGYQVDVFIRVTHHYR